jgi:hypothetical protein
MALSKADELANRDQYAMSSKDRVKTVYFSRKEGELPIVIDSGASFSVTPNIHDFVGPIRPCSRSELNGLNTKISVIGEGDIQWKFQDVFGTVRTLTATAYYVPDAGVRLFSPQIYFMKHQCGSYTMDHKGSSLTLRDGTTLQFPYNDGSSLPIMLTTNHFKTHDKHVGLTYQDSQTLGDINGLQAFMNVATKRIKISHLPKRSSYYGTNAWDTLIFRTSSACCVNLEETNSIRC